MLKCCFCNKVIEDGEGNTPAPIVDDGVSVCCDYCNSTHVTPARVSLMTSKADACDPAFRRKMNNLALIIKTPYAERCS